MYKDVFFWVNIHESYKWAPRIVYDVLRYINMDRASGFKKVSNAAVLTVQKLFVRLHDLKGNKN